MDNRNQSINSPLDVAFCRIYLRGNHAQLQPPRQPLRTLCTVREHLYYAVRAQNFQAMPIKNAEKRR